jgi:O-antigen ligase
VRVLVGSAERGPLVSSAIVVGSLTLLAVAVTHQAPLRIVTPVVAGLVVVTATHSTLLKWRSLVAGIVLVILFVPIRRYTMPGGLPINLEPYRILVGAVGFAWLTSLLVDPRVRLRGTGFEGPLGLFVASALISDVINPSRVSSLGTEVIKRLSFFASFILIAYLIRSLVRTRGDVDFLAKICAGGGAIVSIFAVIESRTGFNVFDHLGKLIPLLRFNGYSYSNAHDYHARAFGSAEHPIALGAGLVLLVPLAVYLAKQTGQHRWRVAVVLLLAGVLASRSRTGIVMLLVMALVYCLLRWSTMKRLWPLILPLLLAMHFALPGAYGALHARFVPKGGLIAQQKQGAGTYGSGRIADLGPGLHEWSHHPFFGDGFGTRISGANEDVPANAPILDDQWLGTLLEIGIVGFAAWVWLFARGIRRFSREARRDESARGWLMAGLAASFAAYAAGMCFYDAFSFSQEVFIFFILLGLGSAALALPSERTRRQSHQRAGAPAPVPVPQH